MSFFNCDEGKQFQNWVIFMTFVAGFVCVTSLFPTRKKKKKSNHFRVGTNEAKIFNY